MKRVVVLPVVRMVPPEAVERLQRKFTESKSREERERFWLAVQNRRQPRSPINFEDLPA